MKNHRFKYEKLEQQNVAPISLHTHAYYHGVKRLPRKFKKRFKKEMPEYLWRSNHLDLSQQLWYRLNKVNPDYVRFLIKKICEQYNGTKIL